MSEKYAVLEWEQGVDDVAHFICKNESFETAELFVRITPPHLHREIRTMKELEENA